ncbi:hypothetical protein CPB86DRAFT_668482, partial [Serendipita vermifera]
LRYLSLEPTYEPKPSTEPVDFLRQYISILPPSLLSSFSPLLTPLQRTKITNIRNRRLQYHSSAPKEFYFPNARNTWTNVWDEVAPRSVLKENWRERGQEGRKEEQEWAERGFLKGKQVVGERSRLGRLLGDYEEERVGEEERKKRGERLRRMEQDEKIAHEAEKYEEDDEEEEEELESEGSVGGDLDIERVKSLFERLLKEQFIDGRLDDFDYDSVDWDDKWDIQSREDEERWFDED